MNVPSIPPPAEPVPPRTTQDPGYFDVPASLLDPTSEGRLVIGAVARLRDGNAILRAVADAAFLNYTNPGAPAYSQEKLTAMTQLAVTGSSAFAAWSANPTQDLTPYLTGLGMDAATSASVNLKIMSDFNAALLAVRTPNAGIDEGALRAGMTIPWIAVSGEDDSPDFPVNTAIAPYPQFHLPITVDGHDLNIRFIVASSQAQGAPQQTPVIPPGDEVILFIHGEGSRAEEANDLIPALFSVGSAANRSLTVIAFDLPSSAYSTMVPHLAIAPMPQASVILGKVNVSGYPGSPIVDFLQKTIETFVETLIVPQGNPITAVVGGSLGGHMALRLASSQNDWVNNVVAWSPASVEDHNFSLGGFQIPQRMLSDPELAGRATDPEQVSSRQDFMSAVWDQNTFDPGQPWFDIAIIAVALISVFPALGAGGILGVIAVLYVAGSLLALPTVPPQPTMWYRDDWGPLVAGSPFGLAKQVYMLEGRFDRREIYCQISRQWHWRICEELLGYTFDPNAVVKPLLLMVGEKDEYAEAHFFDNVKAFAGSLTGPGQAMTVRDTGHSIHAERPYFLASQILAFAPPPAAVQNAGEIWLFAETIPSL